MHYCWLELTKTDGKRVWVWAPDVEMVEDGQLGTVVYLHHDKMIVKDDPIVVIDSCDAINQRTIDDEKSQPPLILCPICGDIDCANAAHKVACVLLKQGIMRQQ